MSQISSRTSLNFLPLLATSDGFVVTPSTRPMEAASLISLISAVSMKNFMASLRCASSDEDVACAGTLRIPPARDKRTPLMTEARIGTVDLPVRIDASSYFRELSYLELSALFAGPLKPSSLAKWAADRTASGAIGAGRAVGPHASQAAEGDQLWPHDATVGDFRDSAARHAPRSPQLACAVDAARRRRTSCSDRRRCSPRRRRTATQLKRFFGEIATEDAVGTTRVWIPDGLWDLRTAVTFANELGVICAFDPLVRDPGQPPEVHYDLERVRALLADRRARALRSDPQRTTGGPRACCSEHYEKLPATIAFESPSRWQDARNLKKTLEGCGDD